MNPLIKKDGPGAALLSITCLITPQMMKESRGNLVITKSLMSFWFGAAPADCEDWTRTKFSVRLKLNRNSKRQRTHIFNFAFIFFAKSNGANNTVP